MPDKHILDYTHLNALIVVLNRRKKPTPKERQYAGQIDVTDYGRIWYETLNTMLSAQTSINKISRALK